MRKAHYLAVGLTALSLLLLPGCSSRQASGGDGEDITMARTDSAVVSGPQRMQASEAVETFMFKGKEYRSVVVRKPDESLPVVKDEQGNAYVDNRVSLRLTSGGKTVADREFTKESFAHLVDASFLKHAILEGFVFDETTSRGIVYAASISYPQTDLYVPLRITVAADGKVTMERQEFMEEVPETEEDI